MITPKFPLLWPPTWKRTAHPRTSKFGHRGVKWSIDQASRQLEAEIVRLTGSRSFIISSNMEYRADGFPYSKQRALGDKGVAVYFKYNKKEMVIACDSFDNLSCNIYAIAKTIEAMRAIERNGSSQLMEQAFSGFQALPERGSGTTWYDFMELPESATEEQIKSRYKQLAKTMHPDVGGSTSMFQMLQDVYQQALQKFNK
jgi:hypothetical protein